MLTHCPACDLHLEPLIALEQMREEAKRIGGWLPGDWVDTRTAAALIGKSESWLRHAVKADSKYGGPAFRKQGGSVRYHLSALVAWQASGRDD